MNINLEEKANLYKGLAYFRETLREKLVSRLKIEFGQDWLQNFYAAISTQQADNFDKCLGPGIKPETRVDFVHFKPLVLKYRDLFRIDFGVKTNNVPTWLDDIADVRNKIAHFDEVHRDEADKAWINMRTIARILGVDGFESSLTQAIASNHKSKGQNPSQNRSDNIIAECVRGNPLLSFKVNSGDEHRVSHSGLQGSMWILPKRNGYRISTTGEVMRVNDEISRLCGPHDREHKGYLFWSSVSAKSLETIINALGRL